MYKQKKSFKMLYFFALFVLVIPAIFLLVKNGVMVNGKDDETNTKAILDTNSEFTYPMKNNTELTFFTRKRPDNYESLNDTIWYERIKEATGVSVHFIHPDAGFESERLYILIASRNMPDIIRNDWVSYPGGPDKAMQDKIIISLNNILPKYSPNYWQLLCENEFLRRYVISDNKQYYQYPMVRDAKTSVFWGPIIRKDWLDELGLSIPETINDWEVMLTAFRDHKLAKSPLTYWANNGQLTNGFITGAFGILNDYYIDDDGKIKYGYAEPEYKEVLSLVRRWYSNGLIDKDVANISKELTHAKMISGEAGAMLGQAEGDMTKIFELNQESGFDLTGAKMPVLNKGDTPKFGHGTFGIGNAESVAISTTCKDIEAAARFLDYTYSQEGILLNYYGSVKGEDYDIINGKIVGLENENVIQYDSKKRNVNYPGFNTMTFEERLELFSFDQIRQAVKYYSETDYLNHLIPSISLLPSESDTIGAAKTQIKSYVEELYLGFMFGDIAIDYYDTFVEKIKQMGLDSILEAMQKALERYNNR